MVRMMTRDEVAGQLNVSPSTLQVMINEKAFPPPIRLGKSDRTDRWPDTTVQEWIRQQQSAAYGSKFGSGGGGRQFFTASEIGKEFGTSANRILAILVACGLLEEGTDENTRYRPTIEAFSRGLFWRVEKFPLRERKLYFQTVVPSRSIDEVLAIVRKALADERRSK